MIRPTRQQFEERVEACLTLLRKGQRDGTIKRAVAARFQISPRTVERYLRRARKALIDEIGRPQEELQADVWAIASGVMADVEATARDKIAAAKLVTDLLGLAKPKKKLVAKLNLGVDDLAHPEIADACNALLQALDAARPAAVNGDTGPSRSRAIGESEVLDAEAHRLPQPPVG